ncbi:two-component system response regulator AtoC [Panacagrimonas perspica]|uniref:Two-component system response regulator AtoC n=1 Tax=Panacagrimonas perspica TaxID=381431 RepID=A0A4S3K9V7_9GAMM|nr:sigma-54 dependent transcriptional regulator [Panacagrimonas perspica]TDU28603.1 two-component system response regulator AtoC [Panacagrimonas perspica]THD04938.1 DNA-binding response regulator [Panacagrimonas perspica]
MTSSPRVLIVDDEPNMRRVLEIMLARRGYRTLAAADGLEAWERVQEGGIDLVVSDLRMPRLDGIELLRRLREAKLDVPLILMTAHGSLDSAVEALRLGACDYLLRPFDVEALELAVNRVFASRRLLQQNDFLRSEVARAKHGLVGISSAMQKLRRQIEQVAPTRTSVLLTGETGTGKEVAARAIHDGSERADALFVPVNCAAIPAEMLESELFGHEKGAFTGAVKHRVGKFELAQSGTLFLDELAEMPVALQAKLLRVIESGEMQRLGGNDAIRLDVRLVAATNRAPQQAIRDGRLREDLYFRLNVFAIELPPLRERREDLPALLAHFAQLQRGAVPSAIASDVVEHLQGYAWPGNVRELRNMVERAFILAGTQDLKPVHFPLDVGAPVVTYATTDHPPSDLRLEPAVEALERSLIAAALRDSGGNKSRAAQKLGISERSIWYKLKKYGLGE